MYFQEPTRPSACEKWNPKNRFLLVCCHTYEVDKGWGCGCFGCRAFPFSLGVIIFGIIMITNCFKDFCEIQYANYLKESRIRTDTFVRFFYFKLFADFLCVLGGILGFFTVWTFSYCLSVVSYYVVAVSFVLNTIFIIYVITEITSARFWLSVGILKVLSVISWFFYEYVWLIFTWLLFCNMVDIYRKKQEESNKTQYNFGF